MISKTRILRATTVLPDYLYVRRAADDELADIIDDMGRPGYVLVARQMGKTNLLLNMKREQEARGDLVVYVDLSQRFKTARACFRHIIDLILEANDTEHFADAANTIREIRSNQNSDPSLEYTRMLRAILRCIPTQKLVIVLDEIDSLVNAPYSDVILAHIRSTYFVRTNYVEFDRLTYVLSGVAEPSDLIKDKNISPFNIGAKIYLANFTRAETQKFADQAQLSTIDVNATERVYYWTRGNPRMTWDIYAELEKLSLAAGRIDDSTVDGVVNKLYLESFDRAPVDHIRVLVSGDASLRSAIVSARYRGMQVIEDDVRSRLYLAGIINGAGPEASIQNPIVDAALSDAWIKQIDAAQRNPARLAMEHFIGGRYTDAIPLFKQSRASGVALANNEHVAFGLSYYRLGDYDRAAEELAAARDRQRGENLTTTLYYLGSALLLTGEKQRAFDALGEVKDHGSGPFKLPAELVLAAANYQLGADFDKEVQRDLIERILDALRFEEVVGELDDPTLVPSHIYSLAYAALGAGYPDDARRLIEAALKIAPAGLLPTMLMTKYAIGADDKEDGTLLAASAAIIDNQLHPVGAELLAGAYTHATLLTIVTELARRSLFSEVRKLVGFVRDNEKLDISELELISSYFVVHGSEPPITLIDVQNVLNAFGEGPRSQKETIAVQRALSHYTPLSTKRDAYYRLLLAVEKVPEETLTQADVEQGMAVLQSMIGDADYRKAAPIIVRVESLMGPEIEPTWRFITHYYSMVIHNSLYNRSEAWEAASALMAAHANLREEDTEELPDFVASVVDQAAKTLARPRPVAPDRFRNIGRNQKVVVREASGHERSPVKFKIVEDDLRSGRLDLIRVLGK